MLCFFVHTKGGHARSAADVIIPAFSSDSKPCTIPHSLPPSLPLSAEQRFRQSGGKWPVSRQTVITKQQFTCHGRAWQCELMRAGRGNSRKELIEELKSGDGPVFQRAVRCAAIKQPALCLQTDIICAGYLILSVISMFAYVGQSF